MCYPCRPADVGRLFGFVHKYGTVSFSYANISDSHANLGRVPLFESELPGFVRKLGMQNQKTTKSPAGIPAGLNQQSVSGLGAFCFECGHDAVVRFCDFLVRERAFRIQIGQRECDRLHAFFHPLSFIHVKDAYFF